MNHRREGSGAPLVLIHGIGMSGRAWNAVAPTLARDFEVFACDSPGFGDSAPLRHAGPPTILAYADAYERWFAEQGLDRPHVAGNSMGGGIALELARRGAVRSATAFSPAGFWSAAELRWCQLVVLQIHAMPAPARSAARRLARTPRGRNAIGRVMYRWPAKVPAADLVDTFETVWAAQAMRPAAAAFSLYTYEPANPPITVPTTVAWGDRDRLLIHRTQSRRARAALPEAEHVTLAAGHLPMTDDPAAVVATIRSAAARA